MKACWSTVVPVWASKSGNDGPKAAKTSPKAKKPPQYNPANWLLTNTIQKNNESKFDQDVDEGGGVGWLVMIIMMRWGEVRVIKICKADKQSNGIKSSELVGGGGT